MNRFGFMLILLIGLTIAAAPVFAEEASAELGKQIFNDPSLGGSTNDKSCNTCHNGGSGLERAGKKKTLTKTIQRCIKGPLRGGKIDDSGIEMQSLRMYIQSLSE